MTDVDATPLTIRRPRADELTATGAVTESAYRAAGMAVGDYADRLRDAVTRDAEAELLVAVDQAGTILGTVTFCPTSSSWREIARPDEGEFRMLAVAPQAQGHGVGTALVDACLARAAALGFRRMVLSTPAQRPGAHRLYERLGFVRDPARDWSPVPGVSLIAYQRAVHLPG